MDSTKVFQKGIPSTKRKKNYPVRGPFWQPPMYQGIVGCTPIPTYPYEKSLLISPIYPYNTWVFMGYYPQESLYKPYKYHGYTVRGTHNCPFYVYVYTNIYIYRHAGLVLLPQCSQVLTSSWIPNYPLRLPLALHSFCMPLLQPLGAQVLKNQCGNPSKPTASCILLTLLILQQAMVFLTDPVIGIHSL